MKGLQRPLHCAGMGGTGWFCVYRAAWAGLCDAVRPPRRVVPSILLGRNHGSKPIQEYVQLSQRSRQRVLWVLSTAVCVPQRRHRTDGLLYRNQDRVPAAEGQGGGGYPGNCVPSPHRQRRDDPDERAVPVPPSHTSSLRFRAAGGGMLLAPSRLPAPCSDLSLHQPWGHLHRNLSCCCQTSEQQQEHPSG